MLPIQQNITTRNFTKGTNKPKYIVIHDVGALGQAHANARYFKTEYRGASAHYFVDPKNIVQVVKDEDTGWHVGDGDGKYGITNRNSIGIEMCLDKNWKVTKETKAHTIDLVHYLQKKYDIPNESIVRHFDASRKICPRSMSANNWSEWKAFYKAITASQSVPERPKGITPKTIKVKAGDTLWGFSKQYDTSIEEIKRLNKLKSDTIITGQTLILKETEKSLSELAEEVILGKHGNGAARKKSLGSQFDAVQALVEEMLNPKPKPKPKPKWVGKRVESIHNGALRFYSKPTWDKKYMVGTIKRGWGFPTVVKRVKVGSGYQYEVKNSKGATYYITASSKYVKLV